MSINRCDICKELEFEACIDIIILQAGVTPSTEFTVWIKDKSDHSYTTTVSSGIDGSLTINMTDFTDKGLIFTSSSGTFELSLSTSDTEDTGETITIDGDEYPCITLSFYDLN